MNTKKLVSTFLLLLILPYFIMIAVFIASPAKNGPVAADVKQYFEISVEDGVIADAVDYIPFLIPEDGTYSFNLDFSVNEPGFYTFFILKDSDGEKAFYFSAFQFSGYSVGAFLHEGRGTLELHYVTSEQGLRDLCAQNSLFSDSEINSFLDSLDFDSFTKTGKWNSLLNMTARELVSAPSYLIALTFVLGAVLIILFLILISKDKHSEEESSKERINGVSIRYALMILIMFTFQLSFSFGIRLFLPRDYISANQVFLSLLLTILTVDVVSFPMILLATRKIPATVPERHPFGFGKYLLFVLMTAGVAGAGAIIGLFFHNLLGSTSTSTIANLMLNSDMFMRVLTVGILAPIFEELIFRKLLIDRLLKHGEFAAIFISGLSFGLFHGNFQQFFFATFIGWLFAFVYVRTGNVINTILLHMTMNMATSVITVYLTTKFMEYNPTLTSDPAVLTEIMTSSPDALKAIAGYSLWLLLLMILAISGFVVFIVFFASKKFKLQRQENEPSKAVILGKIFSTPGYWLFILACIGAFIINYLPGLL